MSALSTTQLDFTELEGDLQVTKVENLNVIVVGLTGSGKSSIIKSLCHVEDGERDIAKMSVRSITKDLKEYSGNLITDPQDPNRRFSVTLFDTVGLGDNNIDVPTVLKQIMEVMPVNMAQIHKIVFCFKVDRLRAKMSEELTVLYNFFKMVGAKPENFVMCLTFCDIFNQKTLQEFWTGLRSYQDLPMVKEIPHVTFTAFPNFSECDTDPDLVKYLHKKLRASKLRIFNSVVNTFCQPFSPNNVILKMPRVEFMQVCGMLMRYKQQRSWFSRLFKGSSNEQEEIMGQLIKLRSLSSASEDQDKAIKEMAEIQRAFESGLIPSQNNPAPAAASAGNAAAASISGGAPGGAAAAVASPAH